MEQELNKRSTYFQDSCWDILDFSVSCLPANHTLAKYRPSFILSSISHPMIVSVQGQSLQRTNQQTSISNRILQLLAILYLFPFPKRSMSAIPSSQQVFVQNIPTSRLVPQMYPPIYPPIWRLGTTDYLSIFLLGKANEPNGLESGYSS